MKKFIFSTIICSLMAFVGCHNEDINIDNNGAQKVVVTAKIEGSDATRVDLTDSTDEDGNPCVKVNWKTSGESFWVRGDGSDANYYEFTQVEGNYFEGTLPSDVNSIYYAYYPQTFDITEQDGTLNEEYVAMTGYCNKGTNPLAFTFVHETFILKPTFTVNGENINSSITNILVENVAYPNSTSLTQNSITVTPDAQEDLYIFISMLYDSDEYYPEGHEFVFWVTTADGTMYKASLTTPITLQRGKLYTATINLENSFCFMPAGYKFRDQIVSKISSTVKHIKFIANSSTQGEEVTGTSAAKAYIVINSAQQALEIHTPAKTFCFNADCSSMFAASSSDYDNMKYLSSIDFANCDTSDVTNMADMFSSCTDLMYIYNLANFDTSKVTDMSYMFWHCGYTYKSQVSFKLDVSNFNTANVTNMSYMFAGCAANEIVMNPETFITSKVSNMRSMFSDISNLTSLDVSHFDTSNVTNMSFMFRGLNLTSLDVSNFNTANVTEMGSMFSDMMHLQELKLSNFNTEKVINMSYMFSSCEKLQKLSLDNFSFTAVLEAHDGTNYKGLCGTFLDLGIDYTDPDGISTVIKVKSGMIADELRSTSGIGLDSNPNIEFRNINFDIV